MMKILYSVGIILFYKTAVCQTNFEKKKWDWEKYLWSYAHNKSKNLEKSVIDFDAIDNWHSMGEYMSICNNGRYFAYNVEKGVGSYQSKTADSLIIQSTEGVWKVSFATRNSGFFTSNNKQYVFLNKDTLNLLLLGTKTIKTIKNVTSYKYAFNRNSFIAYCLDGDERQVILANLSSNNTRKISNVESYAFDNSAQWFIYVQNTMQQELVLLNLNNGKEIRHSFPKSYLFSTDGSSLLVNNGDNLKYIDLTNLHSNIIWQSVDTSKSVGEYKFDQSGKQVVFVIKDVSSRDPSNSIWYYSVDIGKAQKKIDKDNLEFGNNVQIMESVSFTENGRYLQFSVKYKEEEAERIINGAQLSIFSQKDRVLWTNKADRCAAMVLRATLNVNNDKMVLLESDVLRLIQIQGDFALVKRPSSLTYGDRFWELSSFNQDSNWVVLLQDGSRSFLPTTSRELWLSPGGKYLVFFEATKGGHFFSYNLRTGHLKDISPNVSEGQLGKVESIVVTHERPEFPFLPAAWLQNDTGLLVYDTHDIWRLDLAGNVPAVNITNSFGRAHNIVFTLFDGDRFSPPKNEILKEDDNLILRAFNVNNKNNGYFLKSAKNSGNPEILSMGPYFMNIINGCHESGLSNIGMPPQKSANSNVWVIQRQSNNDAPNYYKTTDFKTFKRLTNMQPQNNFNWVSQELHNFNHLDGVSGQGLLYKPEKFDSSKKYPVLIVFYGTYSGNRHQFPIPAYYETAIGPGVFPNWMISNGCLVFASDIYVSPFKYGPTALNVIEGAVEYLKSLPYVDSTRIGCAAHSWSAKLASYIFTHSKSFAAMAISEGFLYSNVISAALSPNASDMNQLSDVERGFHYGSLWEHKELWLDHTTVLNVDKSTSPILLLCNKLSSQEYLNQTFQLFNSLRRLQKSAWWLKYDKGAHTLNDLEEQKDYTIRYTQFFDHYLNNAPAPRWMTKSSPFSVKGFESSYVLDPAGTCSKDCNICKRWNDLIALLQR